LAILNTIKPKMQGLITDQSGQFSLWLGIAALPLLALTTFVIDITSVENKKASLKGALDAAALAAVSNQSLTQDERRLYASEHFNANFEDANLYKLTIEMNSDDQIDLIAEGKSPTMVAGAVGFSDIGIRVESSAIITREHIICLMTLNPDGAESFSLFSGASFNSPNCAVQVNSSHAEASYVDGSSTAIAKDFCITGGAIGNYKPFANTQCAPVADPYADKTAPPSGTCVDLTPFRGKGKHAPAVIGDNVTLYPGTYCDYLTITGQNVTFMPGIYIMDNSELWFRKGAQASAQNVTLVFKGEEGRVLVEQGSSLKIKAPATGTYAGLAIFQDAKSVAGSKFMPTNASELTGGSSMSIVGTVYMPTQKIELWGNSLYSNSSPATSYIGYDVALGKESSLHINVDHESAGLPPILPRTDEGARLLR